MNASDLARLLDVHPSMGSKILRGERSLTVDHLRRCAQGSRSIRGCLWIDAPSQWNENCVCAANKVAR